jgi:hypothetical protein
MPIQAVCEFKYLGNVISPDGMGHVKNDMYTFIHIIEIMYELCSNNMHEYVF